MKARRRILSILLALCMVVPLFPSVDLTQVWAAGSDGTSGGSEKDAFGIGVGSSDFDEEEAKANNPLGGEGWKTLFEVSELSVLFSYGDNGATSATPTTADYTYDYNTSKQVGKITDPESSAETKYGKRTNGKKAQDYSIVDNAAVDAKGSGKKEYTAILGYQESGGLLELKLTDRDGNAVSNTKELGSKSGLSYMDGAYAYYSSAYLAVTAGDFDGDGVDSILVYIAEMNSSKPRIEEYELDGQTLKMKSTVVSNVFDLLDMGDLSEKGLKDKKTRRNAPTVSLTAADTDKDGVDEVVITVNINNTTGGDDNNDRLASRMYIYDSVEEKGEDVWKKSFTLYTSDYDEITGERLRAASSAVGNVAAGNGTDYPEIVTAGRVDNKSGNKNDLSSAEIGSFLTVCQSCEGSGRNTIGNYSSTAMKVLSGSGHTKGDLSFHNTYGFYPSDDEWPLVQVSVGLADGTGTDGYALIEDVVYSYDGINSWTQEFCPEEQNDFDGWINGYMTSNAWTQDSVAGNFDGNTEGKEQFVVAVEAKQCAIDCYFVRIYTYQKNDKGEWTSSYTDSEGVSYLKHRADLAFSLCKSDVDDDSTIARVVESQQVWTDPEVFTVLEAAPYYSELGVSGSTSYSTKKITGTGSASAHTMTTDVIIGVEEGIFGTGGGTEEHITNNFTWETEESETVEYEIEYTNDSGENAVVVYRRPVTVWKYEVYAPEGEENEYLYLSQMGTPATSLVTLEEYNNIVGQYSDEYGLSKISATEFATAGDPFSYPASAAEIHSTGEIRRNGNTSSSAGTGSQTQTISDTVNESSTFTYETGFSFSAWGKVFGVKAGGGGGYDYDTSTTEISGSGVAQSGTVAATGQDGYSFSWELASWRITVDGEEVPVVGYILTNVVGPPSPPASIAVSEITSNSAVLTWEAVTGNRACETYYIYRIYDDGRAAVVGEVDGTETSYELAGLSSNTTYTYAISAYNSSGENAGESVLSEEVVVTTLPEDGAYVKMTSPSDVHVKVGGSATFKATIAVTNSDSYRSTSYQWQKRQGGSAWKDVSGGTHQSLTVENVEQEDDETDYRCVFWVSYDNSASQVPYYSGMATLYVGAVDVESDLTITEWESGEGERTDPYTGVSTYQEQVITEETVTVEVPVILDEDSEKKIPALEVYYTQGENETKHYYGGPEDIDIEQDADGTNGKAVTFYHLERMEDTEGQASYTVGEEAELTKTVLTYQDLSGVTVKLPDEADTQNPLTDETKQYVLQTVVTPDESGKIEDKDLTYYWYSLSSRTLYSYESGAVGSELTESVKGDRYEVYYLGDDQILLAPSVFRIEEDDEDEEADDEDEKADDEDDEDELDYQYLLLTAETKTETKTDEVSGETTEETTKTGYYTLQYLTVEYGSTDGLDLSELTPETKQEESPVETISMETHEGTTLTLTAQVTEDDGEKAPAVGATVDFQIVNISTAASETLTGTTGSDGSATTTWTASRDGFYSIEAIVRADSTYAQDRTGKQYYEAGANYTEDGTEYRLNLKKGDDYVDGSITYGESVSLSLEERTVTVAEKEDEKEVTFGEWDTVSGTVTYSILSDANGGTQRLSSTSYTPQTAGSYLFGASVNGEEDPAATAVLKVAQRDVTVAPTWNSATTPYDEDDVTLTADPALVFVSDEEGTLSGIFDINCPFFDLEKKQDASGRYPVSLSYKTEEKAQSEILAFKTNYLVSLESKEFTVKPDSAQVNFSCGENGTLTGHYTEHGYNMASGSSKTNGTMLDFIALPHSSYAIDYWQINGEKYYTSADLPEGMELDDDREILHIESFDTENHVDGNDALTIYVHFVSTPYRVTYSSDENGDLSVVTGTSLDVESGEKVASGTDLIFTAEPLSGYTVAYWMVNGAIYTWDDSSEQYRGTTLTLSDTSDDVSVVVYYKVQQGPWNVSTQVVEEEELTEASYLAEITVTDALTGETADLSEPVADDTSLTFTATTYVPSVNTIKEWVMSTNGGEDWEEIPNSGEKSSITVYNIEADTIVRAVVTTSQHYDLSWKVVMDTLDGEEVTDPEIADITAVSRDQTLENDNKYSAHIPVDFTLTLDDAYYLVGWDYEGSHLTSEEQTAALAELKMNTEVTAIIAHKPVITITQPTGGTVTVTGTRNGESATLKSGDYVDYDTTLTVTLTPKTGYTVRQSGASYTDGSGETTDAMTYTIKNVQADQTVTGTFEELEQIQVTYSAKTGGSVKASSERKGLSAYKVSSLKSGDTVYSGSTVTLTATPNANYSVSQWTVDGKTYTSSGKTYTGTKLTLTNVTKATTVTVEFVKSAAETKKASETTKASTETKKTTETKASTETKKTTETKTSTETTKAASETKASTAKKTTATTTTKLLRLKGSAKKTSLVLTWNKVKNADGYIVYAARCGNTLKKYKTIKNGSTVKLTRKNLKSGRCYKFLVKAYKKVDGKKKILKSSNTIHVTTTGGKYTNAKSVKVDQSIAKMSVKAGKTKKIPTKKITVTLANKKLKLKGHADYVYFRSDNTKVAKVNRKSGKITGVKKGTCNIYVHAADGVYTKIRLTVK